ncbi:MULTISPECIES: Crp/Fnr family transcriptional regulator [unclassified Modicisalibacter]|nr:MULTISPECIES: Crp/Fnr family transcriptional regulator [unclassified Modicisalibacter]MBZ9557504.1 Crp/Fnr family transcriptional regulator [Modicisalibacter sp. R2A 31.J]MBZ9573831.1 Crp/Fnr family transcriptional regulator [Modicisalibacter sp. MOD 31.J]
MQNLTYHIAFTDHERRLVSALEGPPKVVSKGTRLWEPDEAPRYLYSVHQGWAYTFHRTADNSEQILDIGLPGDVMGLRDLTFTAHYTATEMLTDGIVRPIPVENIHRLFQVAPRVAMALYAATARQQRTITQRLINVLSNDAGSRIAHFALEVHHRLSRSNATVGNTFTLPLTQRQLSLMLGMSEVHVSRTLSDLAARCLVRRQRQSIDILDFEELARIAHFQPERFSDTLNPALSTLDAPSLEGTAS